MTADPSRAPDRSPAWFVVTAQGVILAGPFDREETAGIAYDDVVTRLRHDLERSRQPVDFIVTQVAAVCVRHGLTVGAWNSFEPVDPPA
jgi:hypothetical protein